MNELKNKEYVVISVFYENGDDRLQEYLNSGYSIDRCDVMHCSYGTQHAYQKIAGKIVYILSKEKSIN